MDTFKLYVAIGIGGMFGATSRYTISRFIQFSNTFPTTTLIVNLIGCFLLSYFLQSEFFKRNLSPTILTALSTGVIGSFTTFSTVTIETMELFTLNIWLAILYILLSVFGGVAFCFAGYKLANRSKVTK